MAKSQNKRKFRASFLRILRRLLGTKTYLGLLGMWRSFKRIVKGGKSDMVSKESIYVVKDKIISKKFGVNIIGYIKGESGVGELARGIIKTVEASGIPFSLCNLYQEWMRENDTTYTAFSDELPYDINIIVANADMMPGTISQLGIEKFTDKYNIGCWAWELSEFPKEWNTAFDLVHEVWTISKFCKNTISKNSPKPVLNIARPIEFEVDPKYSHEYFKIDKKSFVFLFTFDGLSFIERKNPFSAAKAYAKSFRNNENTILIIKCHNVQKDQVKILDEILKACNYKLMTKYLDRDEVLGLLNCSDCYVSLHRAEGFGYMLSEAMLLGKHVIGTNWSGNLDFMNNKNSNLIDYKLIEISEDAGPYKKGNLWADADINDAADKMLSVFEKRKDLSVPLNGQKTIKELYSLKLTSGKVKNRLDLIRRQSLINN